LGRDRQNVVPTPLQIRSIEARISYALAATATVTRPLSNHSSLTDSLGPFD